MSTKSVQITDTAYTKLDTGSATAIDAQNNSKLRVRLVLGSSQPAADAAHFYTLQPDDIFSRNGHAGDMWALCLGGNKAFVTVGE